MPKSIERCSTNMSYSSNEPGSTSASMRSRAVSLPLACWASIRRWPPPNRAAARRFSSSFNMFCIRKLRLPLPIQPQTTLLLAQELLFVSLHFAHALQIEDFVDGGDLRFHGMDAAILADFREGLAHGADRRADRMVAPDQEPDLLQFLDPRHRHLRIGRRHQRDRRLAIPGLHEGLDLIRRLLLRMHQDHVSAGGLINTRALQRLLLSETRDQRLGARH